MLANGHAYGYLQDGCKIKPGIHHRSGPHSANTTSSSCGPITPMKSDMV